MAYLNVTINKVDNGYTVEYYKSGTVASSMDGEVGKDITTVHTALEDAIKQAVSHLE